MSKSVTIIDPIHPGQILKDEFLEAYCVSATSFAGRLGVPANRITRIIAGNSRITADTAMLFSAALGTTAEFWLNLQTQYDLEVARGNADTQRRVKSVLGGNPQLAGAPG